MGIRSRFVRSTLYPLGLIVAGALSSCTPETTGPGDGDGTALEPISNLRAYTADQTSVGLSWTSSPSAAADIKDILIRVLSAPGGSEITTRIVSRSESTAVVTNLTEGVKFEFSVIVRADTVAKRRANSTVVNIVWSPAKRLVTQGSGSPVKIYESPGANGIIFLKNSAPAVMSVQNPALLSDTLLIDLYVRSESATSVSLRSASVFSGRALPRKTIFSSVTRDAASLDDPAVAPPDTSTYSETRTSILVTNAAVSTSKILFFRAHNGNYGRILMKKQTNGLLIGGSSPDRFLEFEISYQSAAFNLFSKAR